MLYGLFSLLSLFCKERWVSGIVMSVCLPCSVSITDICIFIKVDMNMMPIEVTFVCTLKFFYVTYVDM
jgi:hypothetical protein